MKARKALSEIKVYNGARTCWVDNNGKCRDVYVRTNDDFNSNGKWHDAALVEYETGAQVAHAANPEKQMGYVRVRATVEVAGECYLFARWYTEHHSLTSFRSGNDNRFSSFLVRHLPALAWNQRTQQASDCYELLSASSLRKSAWVVPDCYRKGLFWHIKHTELVVHQDPEQYEDL